MRRWQGVGLRLGLERREQVLLVGGGLLAAALLVYALIWLPLQRGVQQLRLSVAQSHAELTYMRQAAAEVQRLDNQQAARGRALTPSGSDQAALATANESLATLVDRSARDTDSDFAAALKRVEPQPGGRLNARLEQADFDQLLRWLAALRRVHGVSVVSLAIDAAQRPGLVDARLVLQRQPPPARRQP